MFRTLLCAAKFAALLLIATAPFAAAQDVTLTSRDGSIEITGSLLTFDGEFYRVDTQYGVLVLDGQGVLCAGVGCPNLEDYVAELRIAGARDMGEILLPALFEAYAVRRGLQVLRTMRGDDDFDMVLRDAQADRDVARISFQLSTSAAGFAALTSGTADIALSLREPRPDEVALAQEAGQGNLADPGRARVVALDALVPVVARGNPVEAVVLQSLAAILAGEQATWEAQDAPILLHGRAPQAGIQQAIQDRILAPLELNMTPALQQHDSDAALSDAVARDPLAIGVTRYSEIGNAVPVALAGQCGMVLEADRRRLKSGDYPLTAPLFIYTPDTRLPLFAREFLAYLRTPPAQLVIRRMGFVDQGREAIPLRDQGERLRNALAVADAAVPLDEIQAMLAALDGAARLTTTIRFKGGSTALEAQSVGNVADLARALESGVFDGRELLFVGFSDGQGEWQANKTIAKRRANSVLQAVRKAAFAANPAQVRLRAEGFGEAMPMACDETEWGRGVNRRVEVWLR